MQTKTGNQLYGFYVCVIGQLVDDSAQHGQVDTSDRLTFSGLIDARGVGLLCQELDKRWFVPLLALCLPSSFLDTSCGHGLGLSSVYRQTWCLLSSLPLLQNVYSNDLLALYFWWVFVVVPHPQPNFKLLFPSVKKLSSCRTTGSIEQRLQGKSPNFPLIPGRAHPIGMVHVQCSQVWPSTVDFQKMLNTRF